MTRVEPAVPVERVSIELTQRCAKACWFCYAGSTARGGTAFTADEVVAFVSDLAREGVRAVSFGGGEPLEFEGLFYLLRALRGTLFRSLTTNGLLLDDAMLDALVDAAPDKVHVSVHFPERRAEVERVARQVGELADRGVRSGVNLLVARSQLDAARAATATLRDAGIELDCVVFLPMRGRDTPSPREVADVAGDARFQSMTCLTGCAKSARFASIGWDKTAAWCSYTVARRPLGSLTHAALVAALTDLDLTFCGGTDDNPGRDVVRLSGRA